MPIDITAALAPIKALLLEVKIDHDESKKTINKIDAEITAAQATVDLNQAQIDELKGSSLSSSPARLSELSGYLRASSEMLGYAKFNKEFEEWISQSVDSNYLALEDELKAKILELSGGDESLFAIHVPVRPVGISTRRITGGRQLAIDARMAERLEYMKKKRFRVGSYDEI